MSSNTSQRNDIFCIQIQTSYSFKKETVMQ